jgi:hypothetical protein
VLLSVLTVSTPWLMRWSSFSSADICDVADADLLGGAAAAVVMPGPEAPMDARYAFEAAWPGAVEAASWAFAACNFS